MSEGVGHGGALDKWERCTRASVSSSGLRVSRRGWSAALGADGLWGLGRGVGGTLGRRCAWYMGLEHPPCAAVEGGLASGLGA